MVETITPVVHGGRRTRWAWFLALHVAGATIAAATFGAVLGGLGAALGAPWGAVGIALVVAVAVVYLSAEAFGLRVPVPQLRRQVPDWWRTYFPFGRSAFLYGVGLGIGFLTYLTQGTLVVVAAAAIATGRPLVGAVVLAPFGLARGATAAVARGATSPEASAALVGRIAAAASWRGWRVAHVVVLTAVLAASLLAVTGPLAWRASNAGALGAAVIAVAFGVAATAKVVARRRWLRALRAYGAPTTLEGPVAVGVPVLEALVPILAVAGMPVAAGILATGLLIAFSVAVVAARVRLGARRLECGCFGGVATRDHRLLLARNAGLAIAAVAAWRLGADRWSVSAIERPVGGEIIAAVLVVVGVALIAWLTATATTWLRGGRVRS